MKDRTPVQRIDRSINRDDYQQLPRYPLQVCASLVQNPANLGGLCRTTEAFRLEQLILADLAVTQDSVFKSLAASAYRWQPLLACSIAALPQWLEQQTDYTIVALDADPTAVPLPEFRFPLRSILVLGQELTGIPANILTRCHDRITIPQWGLVESLNVQTAAAVAIYAYVTQHTSFLQPSACPTSTVFHSIG